MIYVSFGLEKGGSTLTALLTKATLERAGYPHLPFSAEARQEIKSDGSFARYGGQINNVNSWPEEVVNALDRGSHRDVPNAFRSLPMRFDERSKVAAQAAMWQYATSVTSRFQSSTPFPEGDPGRRQPSGHHIGLRDKYARWHAAKPGLNVPMARASRAAIANLQPRQ